MGNLHILTLNKSFKRAFSNVSKRYDLAVIGAGPGGYTTAIRAAQNGLKVACIDRRNTAGGTCLNVGCIPSKSLLNSSHNYHAVHSGFAGVSTDHVQFDWSVMLDTKAKLLKQLNMGIQGLFKKNGVDFVIGHATFNSATSVAIRGEDTSSPDRVLEADHFLIATGSEVVPFPGGALPFDGTKIMSSDEALSLKEVPRKLVVVGAGAIGLELASVYQRLGTQVVVLEYANAICSVMDKDISAALEKILRRQGIEIHTGTRVLGGEATDDGVVIKTATEGLESIKGDVALVAMGRRPFTRNLGLEKLGIELENGRIPVGEGFRVPGFENLQAIGDVIKGPMLAHKAEEDGAEALGDLLARLKGTPRPRDSCEDHYGCIPSVIYTEPEIAGVGVTQQQLENDGAEFKSFKFPFLANSRAKIGAPGEGFVKVLADKNNRVLGGWILGMHASEMITILTMAIKFGLTTEEVCKKICFPHPSLSEAIKEACLGIHFKPIHF